MTISSTTSRCTAIMHARTFFSKTGIRIAHTQQELEDETLAGGLPMSIIVFVVRAEARAVLYSLVASSITEQDTTCRLGILWIGPSTFVASGLPPE